MNTSNMAEQAISEVLKGKRAFCKFLTANDSGATGGHQSGILISKTAREILFAPTALEKHIAKREAEIEWQDGLVTTSTFTWYASKNELRITRFGRGFPWLRPEYTGALFILVQCDDDAYRGFVLNTDDGITAFLNAFGLSPVETNHLIDISGDEIQEEKAILEFIDGLTVDFPSSEEMSAAAREIQEHVHDHAEEQRTNPDKKLLAWTETEYMLFRTIEHARYGAKISAGFSSVDEFIEMANHVLNRRKSRAGKSLEHHLAALFDVNHLAYTAQAVTEGNKKPDFLFPSVDAYHDPEWPVERLITLAAKTTCKDRWRQVLNEANRLRNRPKYLCTLQQGISPAQMDEMQAENVILVVPKPYISAYPKDRQNRILTIRDFIALVRENGAGQWQIS